MASNQGWNEERTQTRKKGGGMHQLKGVDMLSAKLDLLMKKLDDKAGNKKEVMHVYDSHMTREECGDTRHSGNHCPEMLEDVNYINNNKRGLTTQVTTQVIIKVTNLTIIIIIINL